MAVKKKYNVLGRGLDALISTDGVQAQGSSTINEIALTRIEANPNQPRREFDEGALQELANSIREIGIIQPITLRQTGDGHYQIIAGERRWRAAQMAGLSTIPAYIRTIRDENIMEMALVENIQREDLNAIEIALAYEHLMATPGMTQEKVAERVGKSRVAVTNYLRLLKLPAQVQMALQNKEIDMGHARALLSLDSPSMQIKLFREIQKKAYSVRRVEEIVRELKKADLQGGDGTTDSNNDRAASTDGGNKNDGTTSQSDSLRARLSDLFGTKVQLTCSAKGKGKISIPFASAEELQRLVNMFDKLTAES